MTALQAPPGRASIEMFSSGIDEPCSPNHAANRSGSVHALKTSSRGASKTRTITIPSASEAAETTPSGGVASAIVDSLPCIGVVACLELATEVLGQSVEEGQPAGIARE